MNVRCEFRGIRGHTPSVLELEPGEESQQKHQTHCHRRWISECRRDIAAHWTRQEQENHVVHTRLLSASINACGQRFGALLRTTLSNRGQCAMLPTDHFRGLSSNFTLGVPGREKMRIYPDSAHLSAGAPVISVSPLHTWMRNAPRCRSISEDQYSTSALGATPQRTAGRRSQPQTPWENGSNLNSGPWEKVRPRGKLVGKTVGKRPQLFPTMVATPVRKPSSKTTGAGNGARTRDFSFGKFEQASAPFRSSQRLEFRTSICVRVVFRCRAAISALTSIG